MPKKENKEWLQSWCDDTNNANLPRVLLIGDSITRAYQGSVREALKDTCCVDCIATSYAIDMPIYHKLIQAFVKDSSYTLIHFNHGLHGIHVSKRTYKSRVKKLIGKIGKNKKIVFATTTIVYLGATRRKHGVWMKRVRERNVAITELADEFGCAINDLCACSTEFPREYYLEDGIHHAPQGIEVLANAVVRSIKNAL